MQTALYLSRWCHKESSWPGSMQ